MPEKINKLAGFEALYQVDMEKRERKSKAEAESKLNTERLEGLEVDLQNESNKESDKVSKPQKNKSNKESNKVSKSESNITSNSAAELLEPTTFKADRRKVLALKRIALNLEPARKLQDLFDEALADIIAKYGQSIE